MSLENVVQEIDNEIARLQEARNILSGSNSANLVPSLKTSGSKVPGKRNLSPAARKRIADAQKRRWAKYNKNKASSAA